MEPDSALSIRLRRMVSLKKCAFPRFGVNLGTTVSVMSDPLRPICARPLCGTSAVVNTMYLGVLPVPVIQEHSKKLQDFPMTFPRSP